MLRTSRRHRGSTSTLALASALTVAAGAAGAASGACSDTSAPATPITLVEAGPDSGAPLDAGADVGEDAGPQLSCAEDGGDGIPQELFCTGLYASPAAMARGEVASGLREFRPARPFWSDASDKRRWISLPAGQTIDTSDMDNWVFPVGTKVWKEFRLPGTNGGPSKLVETRLMWKRAPSGLNAWARATYRWNKEGTRAVRLDKGEKDVDGTTYEVPPQQSCEICHAGHKDELLGFTAVDLGLSGATGVTLASLAREGLLSAPPASPQFTLPEDATGKAAAALQYLHINCGGCHNPSANANAMMTNVFFELRASDLLAGKPVAEHDAYRTAMGVASTRAPYNDGTWFKFASGNPDKSEALDRAGKRGLNQMPPIATHQVDPGLSVVRNWIAASP
jgi:mono/diheme cytochrome c family protein